MLHPTPPPPPPTRHTLPASYQRQIEMVQHDTHSGKLILRHLRVHGEEEEIARDDGSLWDIVARDRRVAVRHVREVDRNGGGESHALRDGRLAQR